ncbi:hypothetical protein GMDG_05267 [Pseudogymnoascus destructans 20631-21]|uniref:Peptidase A1 domain-containing protein n=1 Tax=Pseudogymnoascus destructans (strain ATCC MYA-4855 / 20631-21) TaxID=658429 RepID=L8FMI6_PSED2|nr:hypothetical protein GMDG_05267 [Pseudogymnoascus destructans 20631-21]
MSSHISKAIIIAIIFCRKSAALPGQTQIIPWSSNSYGPDGPWQAVNIRIGTPLQSIDLLPGGSWMSNVLASSLCATSSSCIAQSAGVYDNSSSSTNFEIGQTGSIENSTFSHTVGALPTIFGSAHWMFDTAAVPVREGASGDSFTAIIQDFDMLVVSDGHETLPDGSTYPLTIGKLALGAPEFNQSWNHFPPNPRWNGTFITSSMFGEGRTPSNSYGMHIGSAAFGIPGSLTIGGYDQSRVLSPVSSQPYAIDHLPIDLLDIGIGVEDGASPFDFSSQACLLASGNSSIRNSMQVAVDATVPYLYLPQSTCDSITKNLPVTFQPKYGLYFWNTADPQYKMIVSSPSYLSFTFRLSSSVSQNITIKVPFSLLNLTLTSPIISTPTLYFPCFPGLAPRGIFSLGRSFLQAAFIGVNWQTGKGVWYLAQAPGPNTPTTIAPTAIQPTDNSIISSTTDWADTWSGFWTILDNPTSANTSTVPSGNTAQSGGKLSKAVIGSICAAAAACLIAVLVAGYLLYKRRKGKPAEPNPTSAAHHHVQSQEMSPESEKYTSSVFGPQELFTERAPREMYAQTGMSSPVEMYAPVRR